jgi:hypothetical protein
MWGRPSVFSGLPFPDWQSLLIAADPQCQLDRRAFSEVVRARYGPWNGRNTLPKATSLHGFGRPSSYGRRCADPWPRFVSLAGPKPIRRASPLIRLAPGAKTKPSATSTMSRRVARCLLRALRMPPAFTLHSAQAGANIITISTRFCGEADWQSAAGWQPAPQPIVCATAQIFPGTICGAVASSESSKVKSGLGNSLWRKYQR